MSNKYFNKLYESYIGLWPNKILASDRISTVKNKSMPFEGMRFQTLTDLHNNIADIVCYGPESTETDLLTILDWSMFKILHDLGKKIDHIYIHDLNKEYIRYIFELDIHDNDGISIETKKHYFSHNE